MALSIQTKLDLFAFVAVACPYGQVVTLLLVRESSRCLASSSLASLPLLELNSY